MASTAGITNISPTGGTNLDQFIASLGNLTGGQGQQTLQQGNQQAQSGLNAAGPALQLLTSLTKGDQGDVTQAAQPEIDQISQQFDQIRNMISQQPRGGGKTTALAEAPFQKSAAIQRTEGDMRTKATGQLGQLSTNLAGLGLEQEGIGAGLEGEAASIGLGKQGLNYGQASTLAQINSTAATWL